MKRNLLSLLVIAGLLTVHPLTALAGHGEKGCEHKEKCVKCAIKEQECKVTQLKSKVHLLKSHKDVLKIDEKQWAKIKDIKITAIKDLIQRQANIDIAAVDVKSAVMAPAINTGVVNKLLDKKYAAKKELAVAFVKAIADIQQVLNDEQRAAWQQMMADAESVDDCTKCKGKTKEGYCPITGKKLESATVTEEAE